MKNDKIEDNHSYQKLRDELAGAKMFLRLVKFFSFLGVNTKDLDKAFEKLPEIKSQFDLLSKSPDKFNDHFSKRGWIAHESMNSELMLTAIEFADKGLIDDAERRLIEYYTTDKIYWMLGTLNGVEALSKRHNFFQLAYEDTLAKRYHAVVPILLIMIDGAVNDIDRQTGFFAEKTDLTTWDSIASHSTGLTVLKETFCDGRHKTTTEEISLPYRHGILHGRDLGFANQTVTAKCWCALFAIKDWADAVKKGKRNLPRPVPKSSLLETLSQLKDSLNKYSESNKRNKAARQKMDLWKDRGLIIGTDIPAKGSPSDYADFTPEQESIKFMEFWTKGNYGAIARQIHQFSKIKKSEKIEAGRIRGIFSDKKLKDFKILNVVDCAPVISEVTLRTIIVFDKKQYEKEIILRLIYESPNEEILINGDKGGMWTFIENFFVKIEFLELEI